MADNVVHVRGLVQVLDDEGLLRKSSNRVDYAKLQTTLRRMYALLAIMYGCIEEGALLLTVMDRLLEELAEQIVGHVDPRMETVRMQRAMAVLAQVAGSGDQLHLPSKREEMFSRLERENRARNVFGELARFYRGAFIFAFSGVSNRKSWNSGVQDELWYEELLKYQWRCGLRGCSKQLKIDVMESEKTNMYGLSVAVLDSRLGFPAARYVHLSVLSFLHSASLIHAGLLYQKTAASLTHVYSTSFTTTAITTHLDLSSTTSPIYTTFHANPSAARQDLWRT